MTMPGAHPPVRAVAASRRLPVDGSAWITGWYDSLLGLNSSARSVNAAGPAPPRLATFAFALEWHLKQTCHSVVADMSAAVVDGGSKLALVTPDQFVPQFVTPT